MKGYTALVVLFILAACLSMPVMAGNGFTNKLNLSANITAGNIASDVLVTSDRPFSYNLSTYPSKVVYNQRTGAVANYDGYGAADGVRLKNGDVAYDSFVEEIVFTDRPNTVGVVGQILNGDGSERTGVLQLFYYPLEAPSIEVYAAATLEATKGLGSVKITEYGNGDFGGHPGKVWKITNPANGRVCITGFARLNDHAIQAYTSDFESYKQMNTKMQYWGL